MEGTVASRSTSRRKKTSPTRIFQVDTTNILFICGGAFAGLDKDNRSRGKGTSIGFGAEVKKIKDTNLQKL